MKRQVTTTIEDRYYKEAKKRGIAWCEALRLGVSKLCQMEDGDDLKEVNIRINEQQEEIKRLYNNIGRLQERLKQAEVAK